MRLRYEPKAGSDVVLRAGDDEARARFGDAIDLRAVGAGDEAVRQAAHVVELVGGWLTCCFPAEPGPWRELACDRANDAAAALYRRLVDELGARFEIVDAYVPAND